MSRIFPSQTSETDLPTQGNPNGDRVFRVTDRTIDSRTRLVIAKNPEGAVSDEASAITVLAHSLSHEVTECVELVPTVAYHVPAP